jgi:cell fate regulator YaaT (PSP1 superfamily)
VPDGELVAPLKPVIRKAGDEDRKIILCNKEKAKESA